MFKSVTESQIDSFKLEYYTNSGISYLILDEDIKGTRIHISKLYDFLTTREDVKLNDLFINFTSLRNDKKLPVNTGRELIKDSKTHYGQVGNDYPLSPSQRESLHHFNMCENGDILAINGPPGTGKTTLLHSIIAQLTVDAALKKKEDPPIIVAVSRAKDSFIVFGDSKILDKTQKSKPSGLLAKYVLRN